MAVQVEADQVVTANEVALGLKLPVALHAVEIVFVGPEDRLQRNDEIPAGSRGCPKAIERRDGCGRVAGDHVVFQIGGGGQGAFGTDALYELERGDRAAVLRRAAKGFRGTLGRGRLGGSGSWGVT